MWVTPRMMDIFILKELRKLRWLMARLQTWGSRRAGGHAGGALGRPRGMVQGGRRVQDGEHVYTVHGISQARILEWVAILFSGGSS